MSEESPSVKNNSDKGHGQMLKGFAAGILVFLLAAGAFWFWISRTNAQSAKHAPAGPAVKETLHLEGFVVNLADASGECFLRIGVDLGLGRSVAGHDEKAAQSIPTAQIRDVVLRVLTTYQSDELMGAEGKTRLKQQLLEALQAAVPELAVREVYFTDFLVQR
jgi:flagellar protein FliL